MTLRLLDTLNTHNQHIDNAFFKFNLVHKN